LWRGLCILLIGFVILEQPGWMRARQTDDMTAYHGQRVRVQRIIDGDSFEIDLPDALHHTPTTRVVLFGVNAPEPERNGQPAQPFAKDAADLAAANLTNAPISLWLESHQTRDSIGRLLAHVELQDGAFLTEKLLEAGLAKTDERWPHSRMTRYAQLQLAAQRHALGIWSKTSKR
jgi:endonuclease YncB( thermonuclease family)